MLFGSQDDPMFVNFLQTRSLLNDLPAIFGHAPDEMVEGDSMWWVGAGRWMQQYPLASGGWAFEEHCCPHQPAAEP